MINHSVQKLQKYLLDGLPSLKFRHDFSKILMWP